MTETSPSIMYLSNKTYCHVKRETGEHYVPFKRIKSMYKYVGFYAQSEQEHNLLTAASLNGNGGLCRGKVALVI